MNTINADLSNATDKTSMKTSEQFDMLEINVSWDDLKSTDTVKVGPHSIRFISTGAL